MVGDDYAPPSLVLARRGITDNIVAFSLVGRSGESNPARKLVDGVANGAVDLGIVWGPVAGYFARDEGIAMEIKPVLPSAYMGVPFAYDIAAGVRSGNVELKNRVDEILHAHVADVRKLLDEYAVPRVP